MLDRVIRTWTTIAIGLFGLIAACGCGSKPQPPLRVGTNIWPGYEPLYLAQRLGYYEPGRIKLVEFSSSSEVMRAFRNGAIDVAALTLDEVLLLSETTSDMAVILGLDFSNGADVILSHPEIKNLQDLKGKRVGVEATALGPYVLTRALQSAGMAATDVNLVSLEVSEHELAFSEGRVDAVVTFEPVKTRLLAAGAVQLFDSSQIPGEVIDVLMVRRSFAAKNRAQVEQLVRGWFKALDSIAKDRAKAASLMAGREQISPDEFLKALQGLKLPTLAENRSLLAGPSPTITATARQLAQVMAANRLIQRIPKVEELVDGSFVEDVQP